tara:strand:+ start:951 stop:1112 length:162 start_codon:yes stop_codon:yes gene_type:complete
LIIILVIVNVDGIDVYDENGHVEEMEEATNHVDLQRKLIPLEVDYITNCIRTE